MDRHAPHGYCDRPSCVEKRTPLELRSIMDPWGIPGATLRLLWCPTCEQGSMTLGRITLPATVHVPRDASACHGRQCECHDDGDLPVQAGSTAQVVCLSCGCRYEYDGGS